MRLTEESAPSNPSILDRKRKRCLTGGKRSSKRRVGCPPRKQVRFERKGPNTEDVRTEEKYIDIFRSELDKPALWWSRAEREEITDECHDEIEHFRQECIEQVRHFIVIFEHCQQTPSEETSDYLEKATINLPASIRGLEWGWAPSTIAHRRAHIRDVLAAQDQVKSLNPEMRDRVLSSRSLRSSRPGRVLARILGEGDEIQCKDIERTTEGRRLPCRMMPGW